MDAQLAAAPPQMADELLEEARLLRELSDRAMTDNASRVAKLTEADRHRKERKRGRPVERHRPPLKAVGVAHTRALDTGGAADQRIDR
jgi:hypothetical protein